MKALVATLQAASRIMCAAVGDAADFTEIVIKQARVLDDAVRYVQQSSQHDPASLQERSSQTVYIPANP